MIGMTGRKKDPCGTPKFSSPFSERYLLVPQESFSLRGMIQTI